MKLEFIFTISHEAGGSIAYHTHNTLEIVYYTEGEGVAWLDGEAAKFLPNTFMVVPAGLRHRQSNDTELKGICVGISGCRLEDLKGTWQDGSGVLRYPCKRLLEEINGKSVAYEDVADGLLRQIIGLTRRIILSSETGASEKTHLVEKALHIISENEGVISLEEIADALYLSKDHLRHLVKQVTGKPPVQHMINVRLEKAKKLLGQTTMPVSEVASLCGFSDAYYFSKLFKRVTKSNPSSYRSSIAGKDI